MNGEQLTRWTIDGALVAYVVAVAMLLGTRGRHEESKHATPDKWARLFWALGCALLWAHIVFVFQFYHDWSHTRAFEHTARETAELVGFNFGGGIWFNYVFAAVWT